jgi:hypothetical protein
MDMEWGYQALNRSLSDTLLPDPFAGHEIQLALAGKAGHSTALSERLEQLACYQR